ncbi:MAG: extracellular solute-binding protein [Clostridia bacterium]|nr:extracellular solute-binding protein [Clostridia bacterium]
MFDKRMLFLRKTAAVLLCLALLPVYTHSVLAEENDAENLASLDLYNNSGALDAEINYALPAVHADYLEESKAQAQVKNCTGENGETYNNALVWKSKSGSVIYTADIKKSGYYNIEISYLLSGEEGSNWSFALKIDDKLPLEGADNLVLPRYWRNSDKKRQDASGNEIAPEQISLKNAVSRRLYDFSGVESQPFLFKLEEGEHKFELYNSSLAVTITDFLIAPPEYIPAYSEVLDTYKQAGYEYYDGKTVVVEGEDASVKSSRSLISKADRSSVKLSPSSADRDRLNCIGGTSWQQTGDEIIWEVNVPKKGLYKIGFSYLQNTVINGISYRHLMINGKTPFKEAESVRFDYDTSWNYTGFSDEKGEPYLFALDEGKQQLSLSVTMGDSLDAYNRLKDIISDLGDLYIDITIITGESPDINRDYELFKKIPDWDNRLKNIRDKLGEFSAKLKSTSGKRGSTIIAAADNTYRIIGNMLDNPYTAQIYLSDYYTCYTTLSSWLFDIKNMPLCIDKIDFYSPDVDSAETKTDFFSELAFGLKRFFVSFSDDYASLSGKDSKENAHLKIWVNWGRDQAMVLNNLIEESFGEYSEKELGYKVSVNLELVNASIVKGILSNNAPDLALHQVRSEPVNLGIRGALCDLTEFEDFDGITKRFNSTALQPYTYNGKTYALPDQQTFFLMFYRKDILAQLGISVPKTWDEFLAATAVLQRNNMNSYIPYIKIASETTVNTGVGSLNLYPTILQQFGGSFYNKEQTKCLLDTSGSVEAFKYWVSMYTQYKLPTEADFYNRLRLGTSPLGIAQYTLYNTLTRAAPEIDGRWGIALVPGVKDQKTGKVNHTVSGGSTGCSILSVSKNKEAAWTFLKWWTLAETQLSYNNNVEAIIGSASRVPLATIEAFERMSWKYSDIPVLKAQFEAVSEISEVPGSYYVSRAVDQAFWNVVTNGRNVKDALIEWGNVANEEIERKIEEYDIK